MIPYALSIHGVRDFPTRRIMLGDYDDHVLITGPNGVGKSTLTFCIGAILYSAKVELSGLRSNNLPENKPWHAHMSLLFLNEGPTKIDAPKYISFELVIQQDGLHSLPKREYRIVTGDSEDKLTDTTTYTSGHTGGRNFKAYKDDLQHKYKIDPDLYYLVWYQQEVNQFASMNPEERFRTFSNMFNITNMQKEWEAALERVKEVAREIEDLEATVKGAKYSLSIAENERNDYLNNRSRIITNGQKQYSYTTTLIEKYKEQLIQINQTMEQVQAEKNEFEKKVQIAERHLTEKSENVKTLEAANKSLQAVINEHDEQIQENDRIVNQIDSEVKQLNEQLAEVQEKAKRLRYDEATALEKLATTEEQLKITKEKMEQLKETESTMDQEGKVLFERETRLKVDIESLRDKIAAAKELTAQHKSSHHIKEKIAETEKKYESLRNEGNEIKGKIVELQQTIEQLRQNKVISSRQEAGLADLQGRQIKAYTLRDLLELSPEAPLKLEDKLATIKYSIFYDAKTYRPINDLYYVSLKQIVPDKVINELPALGLQIRRNLPEDLLNHANKALWWIEQFFISLPKIENDILIDERGMRGAQEAKQYILSDAAIQRLLNEKEEKLTKVTAQQRELTKLLEETSNRINEMHGLVRALQEAERDLLEESQMNNKLEELQSITEKLGHINDSLNEIEIERGSLYKNNFQLENELENLRVEIRIHEQLGALAEQQIKRDRLLRKVKELEQDNNELRRLRDDARHKRDANDGKLSDVKQTIRRLKDEIANDKGSFSRRKNRLEEMKDKQEQRDAEITKYTLQVEELENILPEEALKIEEKVSTNLSERTLLTEISKAAIELENARTEKVNINAVENYKKIKEDFEQKNSELTKSVILFEENEKRAKETENQLETTINMYLTKINNLFQSYMNEFQFEGLIEKDRIEEKTGRIKYLLYVKARKIGHQGALEDVSLKARQGKVGKGVSGGEESLSSLLFALALMQNLAISPSYIVLDEFDSALDDERKHKVFELYHTELNRKLIIISPKAHDEVYYNYFREVIVIEHDSSIPQSNIKQIRNKEQQKIEMNYINQTNE